MLTPCATVYFTGLYEAVDNFPIYGITLWPINSNTLRRENNPRGIKIELTWKTALTPSVTAADEDLEEYLRLQQRLENGMVDCLCECASVSSQDLREELKNFRSNTPEESIDQFLKQYSIGQGCGKCYDSFKCVIHTELKEKGET